MNRIIIVVAGCMHHGKDALADRIAQALPDSRRDAFAAPLKMCVHLKTGIPMDVLNGPPEVKNDPKFGRYGKTPRLLMQEEGQEARERIAPTIWMDRVVDRAQRAPERCTVVSDGRHPGEEIEGIRALLGREGTFLGVRVVRPGEPLLLGHPSEDKIAAAPDSIFDVKVVNDGTLDDLTLAAQQVADLAMLRAKTPGKKCPEGWIVRSATWRYPGPFATEEGAKAMASTDVVRIVPTGVTPPEVYPVSYDRIQII